MSALSRAVEIEQGKRSCQQGLLCVRAWLQEHGVWVEGHTILTAHPLQQPRTC